MISNIIKFYRRINILWETTQETIKGTEMLVISIILITMNQLFYQSTG